MLKVENLCFSYDKEVAILENIDFQVERGELVSLLGLSGSGKTSLLRLCAGFERPSSGAIILRGQTVADARSGQFVDCRKRNIGFVFQEFALFNHMSVGQNIEYACTHPEHFERAEELTQLFGLTLHKDKKPAELSGGEKQRVALARSLVLAPDLVLLDEPFSSIDALKTSQLVKDLRSIFQKLQITAVMVTHSQYEAIDFSDRIFLLHKGRLAQQGTAESLYREPKTPFVAQFFGYGSNLPDGTFARPEQLIFCESGTGIQGTVLSCQFRFNQWYVDVGVDVGIDHSVLKVLSEAPEPIGETRWVKLK